MSFTYTFKESDAGKTFRLTASLKSNPSITDSILIMERSSTAGKIITCLNRSEHSQEVNLSAYLTEPKEIFKTNNSTAKSVNPFGIIIVRGN